MTATTTRTLTVFVIIFVLSIYLPGHIITQKGVYAQTSLAEDSSSVPKLNSNFYIDQNFIISPGNNLTISDRNIVITSTELDSINLTVYGHLTLENCTLFLSNKTINRVKSINITIMGSGSLFQVEYSNLNYSGTLYLSDARAILNHSVVGENKGGNVNESNKALRIETFGSNVSVDDSKIGGQMILKDPGNFRAGNIYGVNYNSQYPDSTPGNMTTRAEINTSINPIIDTLNFSISYKALANESSGVYFYLYTKSGILDNITLPYRLGEGMKTIQLNLNVSSMSRRMAFYLNKSDFWLSKEFNTTDALGIFNLSITFYSNSWVRLFGENYFSVISVNSTYYFMNSSTDFNENSFKMSDGAQSYGKSYLDLINSTAVFVDTSVEGSEGTILPVSVVNSTLILAREVELVVNDSGYPYPVENFSINPLNGTYANFQYYRAAGILSKVTDNWESKNQTNAIAVPYFYDSYNNECNFTDFSYSADNGTLTGMVSIDPFPNMGSNASILVRNINMPLESVKLVSAYLNLSGISSFSVNVFGDLEKSSSIDVWVNIENKTDGFNETFNSSITPNSNGSSIIRMNAGGIIPGNVYICSIQRANDESGELTAINGSSVKCLALLNGSATISSASVNNAGGGSSILNASISLNSSHSTAGSVIILNGKSKVMAENVTLLPGENHFSLKAENLSQYPDLFIQVHAPLLSKNTSNIIAVKLVQNYYPEKYLVNFSETGLGEKPMWGVRINGTAYMIYGKQGNISLYPGNYSILAISPSGYRADVDGSLYVINSSSSIKFNFSRILLRLVFINIGSDNRTWKVIIDGSIFETDGRTINISLPSGTYNYEISEPDGYYTTIRSGIVNLTGNASIMIHSKKAKTTFLYLEGVVQTEKYEIASPFILISSIALLLYRRKHRWKIR
jgi:hypothetical protein